MKFRYFFLAVALVLVCIVSIAGFRGDHFQKPPFEVLPDMNYQDKVKDQQPSAFFADGNSARAPIPGTIAEEMPAHNDYWATGKFDAEHWGDGIPVHDSVDGGRALVVDAADMARGRERYTISCEVCHGASGDGKGITSKYGLNGAASYHVDRLRTETDGQLYDTISNGKGQMLGYGYNITIDDRWRIVMYIRALQRGQNATLADATPEEQAELDKTKKPAAPEPAPAPAGQVPSTPSGPTPPNAAMPGQPTGPTAPTGPAPAGAPSPTMVPPPIAPTNNVPPSAKPPGTTMNKTDRTYQAYAAYRSRPVVLLSQATMKGWYDGILLP
jgi:mono/diheme cytochrome c family protein